MFRIMSWLMFGCAAAFALLDQVAAASTPKTRNMKRVSTSGGQEDSADRLVGRCIDTENSELADRQHRRERCRLLPRERASRSKISIRARVIVSLVS